MTAARALCHASCRRLAVAVETFVDGELLPSQVVEVETHLAECPACREGVALTRAMRETLRARSLSAPTSLRDRLKQRLEAERSTVELAPKAPAPLLVVDAEPAPLRANPLPLDASPRRPARRSRAAFFVPLAAVAAAATLVALREPTKQPVATESRPTLVNSASVMPLDGILDELVALHAQPLPPEVTSPEEVRKFDPFVGVPVEAPKLQPFGARWVGGRILPIHGSRTAVLQYSMGSGHRVTVYVYDPARVRAVGLPGGSGGGTGSSRLARSRMVRNVPVLVGHVRGYNVAATEKKGVGYALATDLDEPESAELVAASGP